MSVVALISPSTVTPPSCESGAAGGARRVVSRQVSGPRSGPFPAVPSGDTSVSGDRPSWPADPFDSSFNIVVILGTATDVVGRGGGVRGEAPGAVAVVGRSGKESRDRFLLQ